MILFYALKCGTQDEDTEVLNFACKKLPHGASYDGDNVEDYGYQIGTGRKHKRFVEDMIRQSRTSSEINSKLVTAMNSLVGSVADMNRGI